MLGLAGRCSRRLQQHLCRLGADSAFAKAQEHVREMLGVILSAGTVRRICQGHGAKMAAWQDTETTTATVFAQAVGELEFTVDAGKVNTREEGWKDLKIGSVQKRPRGAAAMPAEYATRVMPKPTARMAWAEIAPAKRFRRRWRQRTRQLGAAQTSDLHVLADGAAWIWKSVDRALTGSQQTLDLYHACEHLAQAGKELYGEGTPAAQEFLERGRRQLLESGWAGVTALVASEIAQEDTPLRRRPLDRLTTYFAKHMQRLDYKKRLTAGQAIGSGAIEGWAKTLGLRLKARGARWRKGNVRKMAALGCVRNGGQWNAYWVAP